MKSRVLAFVLCFGCCLATLSFAASLYAVEQPTGPSVYIQADNGFDTTIVAAMAKKHTPARATDSEDNADYTMKVAPINVHKESTGGKVVRCLFAYCAGIEDTSNVSVQLVDNHTHAIVWGYNVAKGYGAKNNQSMAEAIAKHLGEFLKTQAAAKPKT